MESEIKKSCLCFNAVPVQRQRFMDLTGLFGFI